MKKTKSIFFKTAIILALVVLLLDVLVLALTYKITYNNNLQLAESRLRNAATMTVKSTETYNLYDYVDKPEEGFNFDMICQMFDITYVFIVEPDVRTRSETYIAIGFGENASEEAINTRYPGIRVDGELNDSEIEAYNGNDDGVILHEQSRFDDSLICYLPCTKYFDFKSNTYEDYEKPLVVGTELSLNDYNRSIHNQFNKITILTITLTLLMVVAFGVILYFKVSHPLRVITARISHFVTDRKKGFTKLKVKGEDELAQMSQAFNTMAEEIDTYIGDIEALTREKHTQEAELNIARRIQMGLLQPDNFDTAKMDIDAYILPAKDVGGDLYDYCVLDDGRIFTAIADVSGKGISASLFMSRAITLLHQYAQRGYSPARILERFNDTLAAQNPSGLFITAFVAIFDPQKHELVYSNAGHNYPYIISDKLVTLDSAHGVAAGLFAGEAFEDATLRLAPGDILFMFTDGVNEAKSASGEFYSTQRLEDRLRTCIGSDDPAAIHVVLDELKSFTEGAEQNDDITMLTMRVKPYVSEVTLNLKSDKSELVRIRSAIDQLDISDDKKKTLYLAAEEIFVNICSYAYDTQGEAGLNITVGNVIGMTFTDSGAPFDPTADVIDINDYDHEHSIGGLGRFLVFSVADRYDYEYKDGKNILSLYFNNEVNDQ